MGRVGCMVDGELNDSKYSDPIPWIGVYVAAAALTSALAIAIDALQGFRYKKLWFPCKYFSLNATTLTILGVATKFSVDLNTSMPHSRDQLAKVSSSAFICMVMANVFPSLGNMDNNDLLTNLVALGIFVITVIVNICIQLETGVIFSFWIEHALLVCIMLLLLAILISSALAIPTTKHYLDMEYHRKLKVAVHECLAQRDVSVPTRLREGLIKYWMMAFTSSPQFVLGRSATCNASGALCLLSAGILAEATLRSHFMPRSLHFCRGESDYKWSTTFVFVTQTIAVGIGTIAPTFRWFTAINFSSPKKAGKAFKQTEIKVENYWIKKLVQWKEQPFLLTSYGRKQRRFVHFAKSRILDFCIQMQTGVVIMSKLMRLLSIFVVSILLKLKLLIGCSSVSSNESDIESQRSNNPRWSLSRFVVHLEGEEALVSLMMDNNYDATAHWIGMGKKEEPRNLIQLLKKSSPTGEFEGVPEFDSDQIPPLHSEEPPNCWALPVVTLATIAISLPNIDPKLVKELVSSVSEGLKYVREIEHNLDEKKDLKNSRKAADIVWLEADLHRKWLGVDLSKIVIQDKSPQQVLEELADTAMRRFKEYKKGDIIQANEDFVEIPSRWPIKVLAANSMYRICKTILMHKLQDEPSERLFDSLSIKIANIFRACFTNLRHIISKQCHRRRIEEREGRLKSAILLFGSTEEILRILDHQILEGPDPDRLIHIEDWYPWIKQKDQQQITSSLSSNSMASSNSSDLYVNM